MSTVQPLSFTNVDTTFASLGSLSPFYAIQSLRQQAFRSMGEYRGEANLRKGQFSARIRIRSDGTRKFPSHITISPEIPSANSIQITKLPDVCTCVRVSTLYVYACVLLTLFTPAWLPETALCPQSYRLRAVWHVIERHYVYHRPRTGRSTSYSFTLVLRKLQRKHNRDRRLMM